MLQLPEALRPVRPKVHSRFPRKAVGEALADGFALRRLEGNRIGQAVLLRQGKGAELGVGNGRLRREGFAAVFHGDVGDGLRGVVCENQVALHGFLPLPAGGKKKQEAERPKQLSHPSASRRRSTMVRFDTER